MAPPPKAPSPDPRILELQRGSAAAFEALYAEHRVEVFGFLVRLAADRSVAYDLFQNVWLKLVKAAPRLGPDTNLRAWLFTVARREFIDHRRAQVFDLSRLLAWGREAASASSQAVDQRAEIEAALESLPDADREVLLLVGVHGYSAEEASSLLGLTQVTWRKRLSRARQRFRLALGKQRVLRHPLADTVKGVRS